jgi:hypothetical protein
MNRGVPLQNLGFEELFLVLFFCSSMGVAVTERRPLSSIFDCACARLLLFTFIPSPTYRKKTTNSPTPHLPFFFFLFFYIQHGKVKTWHQATAESVSRLKTLRPPTPAVEPLLPVATTT